MFSLQTDTHIKCYCNVRCFHEPLRIFEVKTSLGALSKKFVGNELVTLTLGSLTLVRVKSARVTAIWIADRYMR